jgi:anti-repressor protein
MQDIIRFEYNQKPVRSMLLDGQPWFVAADICAILGLDNITNALAKLFEDDINQINVTDSLGRQQLTRIVNEGGMWMLVMRSDKEIARKVQYWMTHEVMPSLRQRGFYGMGQSSSMLTVLQNQLSVMQGMLGEMQKTQDRVSTLETRMSLVDALDAEGDERQQLRSLVTQYASRMGIPIGHGWTEFRKAWNNAYRDNIGLRISNHARKTGQRVTAPEYLEAVGRLADALRVAHKMLDGVRRAA